MTAVVAVPYAEDGLFPPCPIPGCRGITDVDGEPCAGCRDLFGQYFTREPGVPKPTTAEIADRDRAVAEIYRERRQLAAAKPERRANQTCWCCEERHTCTRNDRGLWECDTCAGIS
ncbi:hypothetical protein [Mycobacterium sp.]|uniref:hypothetical protein n=1 Tax=Mycobacterium sp. TaxID=1785 RepID=UPI002BBA5648|nr:hypothetical protein [Mycobacterium sp.]HTY35379.1 hypothetical protein [Mycobacterium sp.]